MRVRMIGAAALAVVAAACGGTTEKAADTTGATTPPVGSGQSTDATVAKGGTIRIGVVSDYDYWDGTSYYGDMWSVTSATHNGLLDYPESTGADTATLIPGVAAALPEVSADGLTYTFTIRQGLKFSNGSVLTPDDVKATYERNLDPVSGFTDGALGSGYYNVIDGFDAYTKTDDKGAPAPDRAKEISGIVVNGDTVEFHLTKPNPSFLFATALRFMTIIPKATKHGHTDLPPPGTGPYMLSEYTPGHSAKLVRNPVWPENAKVLGQDTLTNLDNVDEFDFEIGPSPDQQFLRIKNGDLDISQADDAPSGSQVAEVANDPQYRDRFSSTDDAGLSYLFLNTSIAPFDNLKLRQAANYAIDRTALVKVAGGKFNGAPWSPVLPQGLMGGAGGDLYPAVPDLEKAKALIAESGAAAPVTFTLAYITASGVNDQIVSAIKLELDRVGFDVTLKPVSSAVYYQLIQDPKNKVQAGMAGWTQDFPDAITFFKPLLHSAAAGGKGSNYAQFADPTVDAMIDKADLTPIGPERVKAFADLATTVTRDFAPWVVFRSRFKPHFWSANVGNYNYASTKSLYYRLLYVKR